MKVYLIKDEDIEQLRALIDRDPSWGEKGGSSQVLSKVEQDAHDRAHRWFNYQICTWINLVTK